MSLDIVVVLLFEGILDLLVELLLLFLEIGILDDLKTPRTDKQMMMFFPAAPFGKLEAGLSVTEVEFRHDPHIREEIERPVHRSESDTGILFVNPHKYIFSGHVGLLTLVEGLQNYLPGQGHSQSPPLEASIVTSADVVVLHTSTRLLIMILNYKYTWMDGRCQVLGAITKLHSTYYFFELVQGVFEAGVLFSGCLEVSGLRRVLHLFGKVLAAESAYSETDPFQ